MVKKKRDILKYRLHHSPSLQTPSSDGQTSVQQKLTSVSLGLSLLDSVVLDPVQELLSTTRVLDVLHSQVDSLLQVSTVDDLVTDHTDTTGGDVVDDTSLSVVVY